MKRKDIIATILILASARFVEAALARTPEPVRVVEESVDFRTADFFGDGQSTRMADRQTIERVGTDWMRLRIGDFQLGEGSDITVSSLLDGGTQRHTAATLAEWDNWTAVFNGDAVEVVLHVGPYDEGAFVAIETVAYAEVDDIDHPPDPPSAVASLCGTDSRVASSDSRVGRMFFGGCTGWLISNGGVLTAGHCMPNLGGVLEFNVPQSRSNGATVAADPSDQYPISGNYTAFQNSGVGADWGQFLVGTNANTGRSAHIAQGFFRLTDASPEVDTLLRVTGYGVDNTPTGTGGSGAACCDSTNDDVCEYNCNSTSNTLQTSTGPLDEIRGSEIRYRVDTTPANSGSPIIWESDNGLAIGIHDAGGCDSSSAGNVNGGTAFWQPTLAAYINDLRGSSAVYVDVARAILHPFGTVFRPFETVAQGVAAVPNGGVVSIVKGNYPASAGNTFTAGTGNKAMTLEAPVGIVTIGN